MKLPTIINLIAASGLARQTKPLEDDYVPDARYVAPRRLHLQFGLKGLFFLVLVAAGWAWFVGQVMYAKDDSRTNSCLGHLCQITVALQHYHDFHGHFPPAVVYGKDGKPWHSWRVLILPWMEDARTGIYNKYRFDEPWNGPNNLKLIAERNPYFGCARLEGSDDGRCTHFFAVTGPGTAFPPRGWTNKSQISDGLANTIFVVEATDLEIAWTEPRDLVVGAPDSKETRSAAQSMSSPHRRGPGVMMVEWGKYYNVPTPIPPRTLHALATIAGGEKVDPAKIFGN